MHFAINFFCVLSLMFYLFIYFCIYFSWASNLSLEVFHYSFIFSGASFFLFPVILEKLGHYKGSGGQFSCYAILIGFNKNDTTTYLPTKHAVTSNALFVNFLFFAWQKCSVDLEYTRSIFVLLLTNDKCCGNKRLKKFLSDQDSNLSSFLLLIS